MSISHSRPDAAAEREVRQPQTQNVTSQSAQQQRQKDRQQQIDEDEILAQRLAHGYDDGDYQIFRDRWVAERYARSSDDVSLSDAFSELTCRTEYTSALAAEQSAFLGPTVAGTNPEQASAGNHIETQCATLDPEGGRKPSEEEKGQRASPHCLTCTDSKPASQMVAISCGHHMCDECVTTLFTSAMTDETMFPPRCCRTHEIDFEAARPLLNKDLVSQFQDRSLELRTQDRTYCHVSHCSTFIRPDTIVAGVAMCPSCEARTCALCKSRAHQGRDCPLDEGRQQIEQLAQEHGWRQCRSCHRIVELSHGCNHMT